MAQDWSGNRLWNTTSIRQSIFNHTLPVHVHNRLTTQQVHARHSSNFNWLHHAPISPHGIWPRSYWYAGRYNQDFPPFDLPLTATLHDVPLFALSPHSDSVDSLHESCMWVRGLIGVTYLAQMRMLRDSRGCAEQYTSLIFYPLFSLNSGVTDRAAGNNWEYYPAFWWDDSVCIGVEHLVSRRRFHLHVISCDVTLIYVATAHEPACSPGYRLMNSEYRKPDANTNISSLGGW